MGIATISPLGAAITGTQQILWRLTSANMNVTTDQAFTKLGTFNNFFISGILATNASTSLTLAAGGIYTTTAKGAVPVVAAAQIYSALTGPTLGLNLTTAAFGLGLQTTGALYLSLTLGQGTAATADLYVFGYPLT